MGGRRCCLSATMFLFARVALQPALAAPWEEQKAAGKGRGVPQKSSSRFVRRVMRSRIVASVSASQFISTFVQHQRPGAPEFAPRPIPIPATGYRPSLDADIKQVMARALTSSLVN